MTRKVVALTTSRADYGLLRPLLFGIRSHPELDLALVVSGSHLSARYGRTITEIERDGLPVAATIDLNLDALPNTPLGATSVVAAVARESGELFERLQPDVLLVLGDRYELVGACISALLMRIPIAHIHGGEVTVGSTDDSIRHAISKFASLHFPVDAIYANRLAQLGESDDSIHLIDPPVSETIYGFQPASLQTMEAIVGVNLQNPYLVLTFHPATQLGNQSLEELQELLIALNELPDVTVVVTGSNADPTGQLHQQLLDEFVQDQPTSRVSVTSLGHDSYLSLIYWSQGVIGNSSSGVIEAPLLCVPSLDVGCRQSGRVRRQSVTHVHAEHELIISELRKLMQLPRTRSSQPHVPNSTQRVCEVLAYQPLSTLKRFVDR